MAVPPPLSRGPSGPYSWIMRLTMFLALLLALTAAPALAAPVDTGHIKAELVAQEAAVPGGTVCPLAIVVFEC